MANVGDLVASLKIDTNDFIAPLNAATRVAEESSKQITIVIEQQKRSYKDLALQAGATAAGVVAAEAAMGAARIAGHATINAAKFAADHVLEAASVAAAGAVLWRYAGVVNSAARIIVPQYRAIGAAVGAGILAIKVAQSDVGQQAISDIADASRLPEAIDRISSSASKLSAEITGTTSSTLVDLVSGFGMVGWEASGAQAQLDTFGNTITAWSRDAVKAMDDARESTRFYGDGLQTVMFATSNLGMATDTMVSDFYQEAEALRELAKDSKAAITAAESQRSAFKALRDVQEGAALSAQRGEELAQIATIETISAIEQKIEAVRELSRELIQSGSMDKASNEHVTAMFGLLERQRIGIDSGKIKPVTGGDTEGGSFGTPEAVQSMLDAAKNAVQAIQEGEIEAAVASAVARGANEEEASSLRDLLEQKEALQFANELAIGTERALAQAQEENARAMERGAERIAELKDQLAEATGEITKTQSITRQLVRQGIDEDQASQIAELQTALDEAKVKSPKSEKSFKNSAALIGTAQANEIVFSAMSPGSDKQVAEQKKTNGLMEKLIGAVNAKAWDHDNGVDIK